MPRITLKTILDRIDRLDAKTDAIDSKVTKLDAKTDKIDARSDARFEFIKEKFHELKTEFKGDIGRLAKDVRVIRDQTAHITERLAAVEHEQTAAQR